jgi:arabinosyltransferase
VHGLKPYAVHMVWTYGNNYGKAHRMREYMYFYDPPEYYNEGRYITVDITRPEV